mmetsp:Transcript_5802/g.14891  ORF Transcript_5802/g.14891 Transcript_5802/m.14891 type:complete len:243 (+) Transcript_5802:1388-2116(+)
MLSSWVATTTVASTSRRARRASTPRRTYSASIANCAASSATRMPAAMRQPRRQSSASRCTRIQLRRAMGSSPSSLARLHPSTSATRYPRRCTRACSTGLCKRSTLASGRMTTRRDSLDCSTSTASSALPSTTLSNSASTWQTRSCSSTSIATSSKWSRRNTSASRLTGRTSRLKTTRIFWTSSRHLRRASSPLSTSSADFLARRSRNLRRNSTTTLTASMSASNGRRRQRGRASRCTTTLAR